MAGRILDHLGQLSHEETVRLQLGCLTIAVAFGALAIWIRLLKTERELRHLHWEAAVVADEIRASRQERLRKSAPAAEEPLKRPETYG